MSGPLDSDHRRPAFRVPEVCRRELDSCNITAVDVPGGSERFPRTFLLAAAPGSNAGAVPSITFLLARFAKGRFSMGDLEQASALMDAAGKNFSALRGMGNKPAFADEIFGFHVQQTAEKSLKAWLAFLGEDYPPTYDLACLLGMLRERDARTAPFKWLIDYNPYAVQFRYMADPRIAPIDRDAAVRQLEALMEHVRRVLAGHQKAGDDK